jgi:hypothetical protein
MVVSVPVALVDLTPTSDTTHACPPTLITVTRMSRLLSPPSLRHCTASRQRLRLHKTTVTMTVTRLMSRLASAGPRLTQSTADDAACAAKADMSKIVRARASYCRHWCDGPGQVVHSLDCPVLRSSPADAWSRSTCGLPEGEGQQHVGRGGVAQTRAAPAIALDT